MPTNAVIIQNTPVACYLAANAIEKNRIKGRGFLDDKLAIKLRIVYRFVKKIYDLDPLHDGMFAACNYMWELCGAFGVMALGITGTTSGGGQITPITPIAPFNFLYLIPITASDFATPTNYNDSRIAGKELQVFWNNVDRYLEIGTELIYTPTGFSVFIDDGLGNNSFNAFTTNSDAEFKIYIVHPTGTTVTPTTGTGVVAYQGIGGETEFIDDSLIGKTALMIFRGTPYDIIIGGSPTASQVKFLSATGEVIFNVGNPIASGESVYVLYV
jgi:hypothetical protein